MEPVLTGAAAEPLAATEPRRLRVLSLMEGGYVTGPAKGLLQLAGHGLTYQGPHPRLEIIPVIFTRGSFRPEPLIRALEDLKLPFEVIHERQRFDRSVFGQLRRLIERHQPHIVETHMVKSHFIMRYSGAPALTRWVAYHHGYTRVDLKVRIYNEFDRWSLATADHIVAVCGPFAGQLRTRGIPDSRISIQHNSVEPFERPPAAEVAALKASLGLTGQQPVLIAVGRLSAEKGFADLIDAASLVRTKTSNFRLVIVGEGPERKRLEAAIRRFGLQQHVILAGHTNRMSPFYAMASMLVVSSHSEGSPNMLLEGMAAGLPIVTTAAGGIPEMVIHDENALLVPCRDPLRLSLAMFELLNNQEKAARLGAAAGHAAATRFSIGSHYESIAELEGRVVDSVRRGPAA